MRSFHHQQRNIFKTSCRAPIHFSSSSLLSLEFLSLLIHRAIRIVRSHPPTSSTSSTRGVGGELGGDLRVVRKRRFQKQVSKSPCSTHQTSPLFRHFFDAFSCDFFAFVLSEINDASIRNPPWYLDEETRRRWWAGAPWQLRLGECMPLF